MSWSNTLPLKMFALLLLMFLLHDADTTCPTELNPLTLDPPELIGEYGESFLVNCTSADVYHEGMYWKIGNTDNDMEDENNFIPQWVSLSDWDIKVECRIKLNDSFECSRSLEITIYKRPDFVSISELHNGVTVEGEVLTLTCHITHVVPVQGLGVKWYHGNETIQTETYNNTGVTPVNASFSLGFQPGRDDNGTNFRCEVELHLGPKAPELILTSSPHYIVVVHYKPLIHGCPDHYTSMEKEFSVDMLSCRADGNPPPNIQWFYQGKRINASEPLSRTQAGTFTVQAVNRIGTSNASVHITMEYAPELKTNTEDVFVHVGNDVTLNCGAEGSPPPIFSWKHDGENLPEFTDNLTITGVMTSTTYTCRAINKLGIVTKKIHVHVIDDSVTSTHATIIIHEASVQADCPLILLPIEAVVRLGDPVSLNCSKTATNHSEMRWEATSGDTGLSTLPTVPGMITNPQESTGEPNCYGILKDNQCFKIPNIIIYNSPYNESASAFAQGVMVEGMEYLLSCDIVHMAPVQGLGVKWYHDNETIHTETYNNSGVTPVNASFSLGFQPGRDDNGTSFRCEVELHLGPKAPELILTPSRYYTVVVHYKPLIQGCPDHYTSMEKEFSVDMLSCRADGNPPPNIQWFYQGKRINASEPLSRTQTGTYTVQAVNSIGTSNASVHITMESLRATLHPRSTGTTPQRRT
ncbi:cdc42-interacting protein 4 homolog isoform X2 [Antennarius striatus]|uniref:cdc42-interacting protein 4 homolog isoform X2 n=1 Tax=Antennarius striatus TaxID=241820 RepID=UPI0035ADB12D